jgi:hypothetical protein
VKFKLEMSSTIIIIFVSQSIFIFKEFFKNISPCSCYRGMHMYTIH